LFSEACSREQQLFQLTWNLPPKALAVWVVARRSATHPIAHPVTLCGYSNPAAVRSKLLIFMVRPE
jgi:hypothetical protein